MRNYAVCRDKAEQSLTFLKAVASKNLEETLGREHATGAEFCRSATAAEMRKGLSALKNVLTLFGNPQRSVPVVHIVGSKGKGSVSHLIAGALLQIGLKVGTFRSPHVICPTERLQFGRCPIDIGDTPVWPGNRKTILQALRSLSVMYELSAFETEVAAAFLAFRSLKCDIAVVEAGLGGLNDATIVVPPSAIAATVITKISMEHAEVIGPTLEDIARNKCGAIRAGRPVVVADQDDSGVVSEITKAAALSSSELVWAHKNASSTHVKSTFSADTPYMECTVNWQGRKTTMCSRMLGPHQIQNIEVAATILNVLSRRFPELRGRNGANSLAQAMMVEPPPARFQLIYSKLWDYKYPWVVDGAHAPISALALGQTLQWSFPSANFTICLAMAKDKDANLFVSNLVTSLSLSRIANVVIVEDSKAIGRDAASVQVLKKAFIESGVDPDRIFCPQDSERLQHSNNSGSAAALSPEPSPPTILDAVMETKSLALESESVPVFTGSLRAAGPVLRILKNGSKAAYESDSLCVANMRS